MRRSALLAGFALAATAAPAGAQSPPLAGRYDALAEAAGACVKATGREGVDRKVLASSGWGESSSGEIDHNPVSWAYSKRNPFILRINAFQFGDPEQCWMTAGFKKLKDFAEVRSRLERLIGRAPDKVESDDMRETTWVNAENSLELWMMPASKLCSECPTMFVTIRPRPSE